ncbi:MAG: T9SS type A sorting domain-containing protein [Bacteroidota bacterium]|nr:T9SS type A sorting domain-containing protein [Bacteroidota bacterium]
MVKIYLVIFLSLFYFSSSKAGTWYSGPAGNWCSQPDGKGQCTDNPKEQDDLIVDRAISLKGSFNPKGIVTILDGGILTITNSQSGDMQIHGALEVKSGGNLIIERHLTLKSKSAVYVAKNASILTSGDFKNGNNSTDIIIDGKLEIGQDFDNGNNAEIKGSGQISIAGSCKNSGKVFGVSNTCAGVKNLTLPVELLFFEAKIFGNAIQLSWATASEENFDYFVVERSIDAKEFSAVGKPVKGAGNSTNISNYTFVDDAPYSGRSYYRLKAVDFDGTIEYHPVTTVNFSGETDFKIYPNPTSGNNINVTIVTPHSGNRFIRIYNIIGEEVFKAKFNNGTNAYTFNEPLEKGLYIVIVEDGANKRQMKLTVN